MTLPSAFFFIYSFSKCLGIIIGSDQHRHLEDNRPIIIGDVVNKMHRHRALGYLASMVSCHDCFMYIMPVHFWSAKLWQWSRVYIDCFCRIEASYKLYPPGAH